MPTPIRWGSELLLNSVTSLDQLAPRLAASGDGRFAAIWTDRSGTDDDTDGLRWRIFDAAGAGTGDDRPANALDPGHQSGADLAALAGGRFAAVWNDPGTPGTLGAAIRMRLFAADGSPLGKETLLASDGVMASAPRIASLPDGGYVVTWAQVSDSPQFVSDPPLHAELRARVFDADGTPRSGVIAVNVAAGVPLTSNGDQTNPDVTALADGRFLVTWEDGRLVGLDEDGVNLFGRIYESDGTAASDPFMVAGGIGSESQPVVAGLADGGWVVAWTKVNSGFGAPDDVSGSMVRATVFGADGQPVRSDFLVNTSTSGSQHSPMVAALPDGRFVAAWTDDGGDGSGTAVRGQLYDADGTPSGSEFLVNATTQGYQRLGSVEALADGRFVVTWTDASGQGGDDSGTGLRAQIFDPRTEAIQLVGTARADHYVGTAWGDSLRGAKGDDSLDGGAGDDVLLGGRGDDSFTLDSVFDSATEQAGQGTDTIRATFSVALSDYPNIENVVLLGGAALSALGTVLANSLAGNDAANSLTGGKGEDVLLGKGGGDVLFGGGGDDRLDGGAQDDQMFGGGGDDVFVIDGGDTVVEHEGGGRDTIRTASVHVDLAFLAEVEDVELRGLAQLSAVGSGGANRLTGNAGSNELHGAGGADALSGGFGADLLDGGAGDDGLRGGGDGDIFRFAPSGGDDRILDWQNGEDQIWLFTASFASEAAALSRFRQAGDDVVFVAPGGGATLTIQDAKLSQIGTDDFFLGLLPP